LAAGKFLVARRGLPSPFFAETVIFLTHHDRKGAMGLIVNRPTDVPLSRALREIPGSQAREDFLYEGGPVENRGVLALLRSRGKLEGAQHVVADVYLIASKALLEKTLASGPLPSSFRVYLGYSGWGPGQLEREMEMGSWFVLDPGAGAAFDKDPETLWSRLIRLTELQIAHARHAEGSPAS
jgi:putative transcriptional regulator